MKLVTWLLEANYYPDENVAKIAIATGHVKVDGAIEWKPDAQLSLGGHWIEVQGRPGVEAKIALTFERLVKDHPKLAEIAYTAGYVEAWTRAHQFQGQYDSQGSFAAYRKEFTS